MAIIKNQYQYYKPKQCRRAPVIQRNAQHKLRHSPVHPEDEVMQVDAQGNNLTIPQDLAGQIDAIQEEEVDPESLLLPEMNSRHLRGELNSIEDVRITFETLLDANFSISADFMFDVSLAHAKF